MAGDALELIAVEVSANLDRLDSQMQGASRVVDVHTQRIVQSVETSERAIVQSADRAGDAMERTGGASRQMAMQFSQMGQQVAAGASPLQALAIQLPDLAVVMSQAGGEAGALARFFGGPWGIALTTAGSVALALIPSIAGIGDEAVRSASKVDEMTAALDRLRKAQGRATAEQLGDAQTQVFKAKANLQAVLSNAGNPTVLDRVLGQRGLVNQARRVGEARNLLREAEGVLAATKIRYDTARRLDAADEAASTSGGGGRPRTRGGGSTSSRSAAGVDREAVAQQRLNERLDEQFLKTQSQLQLEGQLAELRAKGTEEAARAADIMEAQARIAAQFPELDKERLKILQDIAAININAGYDRKNEKEELERNLDNIAKEKEARERAAADLQRKQEQQVFTLANLYEDAFRGGTDAIWRDFKNIGLRVVAEVLAKFTIAKLNGKSFDLGGALSSVVGSVLPGFATGGSMVIGGRGGTDNNTLALNGTPIARVSAGEHLNIVNPALSRNRGGNTVISAPQFNLANAVVTSELYADMQRISEQSAARAGGAAFAQSQQSAPGTINKYNQLRG